ncbi:T9SS type A sorting domain-containing protein [Aquimarina rubra]|uniref:T9SS type A sorting domain-containing protein n=1 Tax=Aquimarina rubra TaxID=1920033 RepID=A0ABW5LN48_9FLAO
MIRTLFSFLLCFGSISSITAQYSISYDSANPVTVAAGESIVLDYTYTASMEVGAQFQIFETDNAAIFEGSTANGTGVAEFPTLSIATNQAGQITLNIPPDFPSSASLASGIEYRIFGKLSSAGNPDGMGDVDWRIGGTEYPLIVITPPAYSITYDFTAPLTVAAGESVTLNYTYSASMDVGSQFQIFEADSPTIFNGSTNTGTSVNVTPNLTAGSDVVTSVTIDIPTDFPQSSTLSGTSYYIFGKLANASNPDGGALDATWSVNGNYPEIIVSGVLSTNEFDFDKKEMYFDYATASLVLSDSFRTEGLQIYNTNGKRVLNMPNVDNANQINLSQLPRGLYIVKTDITSLKFIR